MIYILIGIIVILFLVIVYQRNSYKNEQSKAYQKKVQNLLYDYNEERQKRQKEYDEFLLSIKEKEKLCDQLVEKEQQRIDEKVLAYSNKKYDEAEKEITHYYVLRQEAINREVVQLENDYNTHKENLNRDI